MDCSNVSLFALYSPECKPVKLCDGCNKLPKPFPPMIAAFSISSDSELDKDQFQYIHLVNEKNPKECFELGRISHKDRAFCWQPFHSEDFQVPDGDHNYFLNLGTEAEFLTTMAGPNDSEMCDHQFENSSETNSNEKKMNELNETSKVKSENTDIDEIEAETSKNIESERLEPPQVSEELFHNPPVLSSETTSEPSKESLPNYLISSTHCEKPEERIQDSKMCDAKPVDSDEEMSQECSQTESQEIVPSCDVPEDDMITTAPQSPITQKMDVQISANELTPQLQVQGTPSRPPGMTHTASKKRKASSPANDDEMKTPTSTRKRQSTRQRPPPASPAVSSPLSARTPNARRKGQENQKRGSKKGSKAPCPSVRWGHTLCDVGRQISLLIGGQGNSQALCKDSIWMLDTETSTWSIPPVVALSDKAPSRMGHTATFDPEIKSVFVFGGSKNLRWFSDMHVLDLDTWRWSHIEASGMAPTRAYHSCTLFRNELYIFGGVFPNPDPEPDGCSNDVFIFSPESESWYRPVTMGKKPKPRSGHSATLLGEKLVVFGGWDAPICYNDLHILDLCLMEFTEPTINGSPPSPRSWHASIALPHNRILIHGGYNGDEALSDAFIFNLDTLTWTEVELKSRDPIGIRAGHTFTYYHDNQSDKNEKENEPCEEYILAVFGGGDNEDNFFNDLIPLTLP